MQGITVDFRIFTFVVAINVLLPTTPVVATIFTAVSFVIMTRLPKPNMYEDRT